MPDTTLEDVRTEVEDIHVFFVDWFTGACPSDDATFESRLLRRFAPGFKYVLPGGVMLDTEALATGLRKGHGTNPDFRIAIRNVEIQQRGEGFVVATYEELQMNARASKPANNARLSSAVFAPDGDALKWLHLHETWLAPDVMSAGPYDF